MRAIIAGGGTGGHVIPALAIAQELQKNLRRRSDFHRHRSRHREPPCARRRISFATRQYWRAQQCELRDSPEDVFGSSAGGVGSPSHIFRVSSRCRDRSRRICVGPGDDGCNFAAAFQRSCLNLTVFLDSRIVWLPVVFQSRRAFFGNVTYFRRCKSREFRCVRRSSRCPEALDNGMPTLLVFGGSQGAHAINRGCDSTRLRHCASEFPDLHIIHQTGERDYNDAQAAYAGLGELGSKCIALSTTCQAFSARRFGALPLGSEHCGGNSRGREAGDFCSVSACCRRSSETQCRSIGESRSGGNA